MIMNKVKKNTLVLAILLIISVSVMSVQFYHSDKEEKRQFQAFLNHFYAQINHTLIKIDSLIENRPEDESLNRFLLSFEQELLRADAILENGSYLLRDKITYIRLFKEMTYLLNGYSMSGLVTAELPPIALDGVISDDELHLLIDMREYLHNMKNDVYSSKTGQWNPELTVKDLDRIIRNYAHVSASDIFWKTYKTKGSESRS